MNGKLLISLFAGLLLAGCAGATWAQDTECVRMEVRDAKCKGNKNAPVVKIYAEKKEIKPEWVCAATNSVIEFKVLPPGKTAVGAIAVKAKETSNTWLIGTNYPANKRIEILVPEWVDVGSDHEYNIIFGDGTCIDPRVHVED